MIYFRSSDKEVLRKLGTVRVGDRVALTWEMPEGKRVVVELDRESRLVDQHRQTLEKLKNGDTIEAEVFHLKDGVLSVIELLRKVE